MQHKCNTPKVAARLLELREVLRAFGVSIDIDVRVDDRGAAGGYIPLDVPVERLDEYLEDPDAWAAREYGVPVAELRLWRDQNYTAQCGYVTKRGRRRKHHVTGGLGCLAADFVRLDGDYCAVHGGRRAC